MRSRREEVGRIASREVSCDAEEGGDVAGEGVCREEEGWFLHIVHVGCGVVR